MNNVSDKVTQLIGTIHEMDKAYSLLLNRLQAHFQALTKLNTAEINKQLEQIEPIINFVHAKKKHYLAMLNSCLPNCQQSKNLFPLLNQSEKSLFSLHLNKLNQSILACKKQSIKNATIMQQHKEQFQKYYTPQDTADIYVP